MRNSPTLLADADRENPVDCLHGGRVDQPAFLIRDRTRDGPGNLLSKREDAAGENEDERRENSRTRR